MKLQRLALFLFILLLPSMGLAQARTPQRIISLGSVITEEIYLLSSSDKLVGDTIYCQRPGPAKLKVKVGDILNVNLEKVVSLKPDVVLATELTDIRAKQKLRALGIRVEDIPNAKNFDDICNVFLKLGKILDKEIQARTIIAQARRMVGRLRGKVSPMSKRRVFIQVGVNPLVTVGKDTFADDFINFSGGVNVVEQKGYVQYSKENVLSLDPDVFIISSMGFDGKNEKINWEKYHSLRAVAHHNIYIIDQYFLCSPTPVSFIETLKTFIHDLHPEIVL